MGFVSVSSFYFEFVCDTFTKVIEKDIAKIASRDFHIETVVVFYGRRIGELSSSHSMPFLIPKF